MELLSRCWGERKANVPGLMVAREALSDVEEAAILEALDADGTPWTKRSSRVTRNYGYFYVYRKANGAKQPAERAVRYTSLPRWAAVFLADRVQQLFALDKDWAVNQAHVSLYRRKERHRIRPHNDCDMGDLRHAVVGISLGDAATMTFDSPDGDRRNIKLPRRSAYAMTGDALRRWRHGIRPENVSGTRLSITLRHVARLYLDDAPEFPAHLASANLIASAASALSQAAATAADDDADENNDPEPNKQDVHRRRSPANAPVVQLRKEIVVDVPQDDVDRLIAAHRLDTTTDDVPNMQS